MKGQVLARFAQIKQHTVQVPQGSEVSGPHQVTNQIPRYDLQGVRLEQEFAEERSRAFIRACVGWNRYILS